MSTIAFAERAVHSSHLSVPEILNVMLETYRGSSDIFFSPGRPPQVEVSGNLVAAEVPGLTSLTANDTARIASELIGSNNMALEKLASDGACDLSYSVPSLSRFRVNIFTQRGSRAVVMRVIPSVIPTLETLGLPPQIGDITAVSNGLVVVSGPTASGKSYTLAALIDKINRERAYHIITIEDPIEFLHAHKKSTVHQRELHSDAPSFAHALRAALRQAPRVILVGEMRDRETIEVALEAAETGHLVLAALHTIDASKTVERLVSAFPPSDQGHVRSRLAKSFRYIVSQRLIPTKDRQGRVAAVEILKSTIRTREYVEKGESNGKSFVDAMRDGALEGMQHFDAEIERLIRSEAIDMWTGLSYATNPGNLRLQLADFQETSTSEFSS
ncbi:MAG TPA: PilT/PilU family type 4a pilus ATPase [Terriglobia bacterium]|nr:PilT/PilU family type 4a pilus ATPase [Terriglobia bacterium]